VVIKSVEVERAMLKELRSWNCDQRAMQRGVIKGCVEEEDDQELWEDDQESCREEDQKSGENDINRECCYETAFQKQQNESSEKVRG
jgi:hypothetical protein